MDRRLWALGLCGGISLHIGALLSILIGRFDRSRDETSLSAGMSSAELIVSTFLCLSVRRRGASASGQASLTGEYSACKQGQDYWINKVDGPVVRGAIFKFGDGGVGGPLGGSKF